jgi:hypothetical protein
LVVDPEGVITAFGLATASSEERPIGEALVASDRHEAYLLADKGFTGVHWERRWLQEYGAPVAAPPLRRLPQGVAEGRSSLGYLR